jgi:uridine kinase
MILRTKANTFTANFEDGSESIFLKGIDLFEILEYNSPDIKDTVILAKVNNTIVDLRQVMEKNCTIAWLTHNTIEGRRAYQQSLCLILIRALEELYPSKKLYIDHSLGKGLYCEFKGKESLNQRMINKLIKQMQSIIFKNESITPVTLSVKEAIELLQAFEEDTIKHIENTNQSHLTLYKCGDTIDYLGYPLFPFTGFMTVFELRYWPPGMILIPPDDSNHHSVPSFIQPKKLFQIFHEYGRWENIIGIVKAEDLNKAISLKSINDLIKIAEGLHEKKIAYIADDLAKRKKKLRVALIAGPSSSGKTTFTKRLEIQLRVNGFKPLLISLDDYFLNREETPLDAQGHYDYESLKAINVQGFNNDINNLLQGKEVQLPRFDFVQGKSIAGPIRNLGKNQIILVEGLHCLNNKLTSDIPKENKYKIYVSALTQLNMTDHLRVPTSDVRLLRRLIRGYQFRGHNADETLQQWSRVRMGEEKYIFPFQEEADTIFNSALFYELSVLNVFTVPLLQKISTDHIVFPEAQRILQLLNSFLPVSEKFVPLNSILREFIGGSSFSY